jgi:hypothetical protein
MTNYLERVAAAGARTGPQAPPAVAAPPRLPSVPQPPLANSLAESSSSDGIIIFTTPATTPQPAMSRVPASLGCSASPDKPSAEVTIAQQVGPEADPQNYGRPDNPSLPVPSDTPVCAPGSSYQAQSAAKSALHIELTRLMQPPLANSLAESSSSDGIIFTPATTPQPPMPRVPASLSCSASPDKPSAGVTIAQQIGPEADPQNDGRPDNRSLPLPLDTPAMPALHIEPTHLAADLPHEIADPARHAPRASTPSPPIESAPRDTAHAANEGNAPRARVRLREHRPVANPTAPVTRSQMNRAAKVTSPPLSTDFLTPHHTPTHISEKLPTVKVIAPQPGPSATKQVHRLSVTPSEVESSGTPLGVAKSLSNTDKSTALMSQSAPPRLGPRFPQILPSQPAQVQPASMATAAPPALSEQAPEESPSRRQPALTPPDASHLKRPPQARETPNTPRPGVNPPVPVALPRLNQVDHAAPLPPSTGFASARKNATRVAIGRIEVQVNNHPQSIPAPRTEGRFAPQKINLESRFLTRFVIRP